ncbi:aminotransferase class V-fold PLP-dependent enzyme [Candidatus Parcubacteria bacterium]|nr:aminotransferase class V-fold PLP-dependent enzyme [Candidatus Parcubacteria bacterium]
MNLFKKKRIFLDYAGGVGNPSGIHKEGVEARKSLEDARQKVARILECQTRDIIFTSGGTESDNLAILGVKQGHIIISDEEHPAVYEAAREAERRGSTLSIVPVDKIIETIKDDTVLVSLIYANNETGRVNPVPKIARQIAALRNKRGSQYPYIHTDATAGFGLLEININKLPVDLLTLDKVLVVRPRVEIRPLIFGGGQERGLRAGTENVSAILEFVNDLEASVRVREAEYERLADLKRVFIEEVEKLPSAVVNSTAESLPSIVSVSFPGELHEFLAVKLDEKGVAVSTGSSCASSKDEPDKEALRFSFGPKTSEIEVREVISILQKIVIK